MVSQFILHLAGTSRLTHCFHANPLWEKVTDLCLLCTFLYDGIFPSVIIKVPEQQSPG